MNWTTVVPNDYGWYWWRADEHDESPVILRLIGRFVTVGFPEFDPFNRMQPGPIDTDISYFDGGQWCGPLFPPKGAGAPRMQPGIGLFYQRRLARRGKHEIGTCLR